MMVDLACVRLAQPSDVPALAALEKAHQPSPWSSGHFRDAIFGNYQVVVLSDRPGRIFAYAVMQIAASEAHLLNIVVSKEKQGQGWGTFFLHFLLDWAKTAGAREMFLEARPSNARALALYARLGFSVYGRRNNYYPRSLLGRREDALLLKRRVL